MEMSIYKRIEKRYANIYGENNFNANLVSAIVDEVTQIRKSRNCKNKKWSEQDIILITYGDSIFEKEKKPLNTLKEFLLKYLEDVVNYIHILPFFPYSSDDGFSVIDYRQVNPALGDWNDVEEINRHFRLMADLVINHISQHSKWFKNYLNGEKPGDGYFIESDPSEDLSKVVRPRSLPLLTPVDTLFGKKHVWTTFSEDQIDLNFANPELLTEMLKVFLFYISKGIQIIRLDAIAFLWKEIGTTCLHLRQTHEVVRLMRDMVDYIDSGIILITETNVPNKENLSYFGEGDEANMVYQFSLPPLLLHALFTADSSYLSEWAGSILHIPDGCTFFNFTASHDGIGIRPLEGLLPDDEVMELTGAMQDYGGRISTKRNADGTDSPYEMNITYLDALKYTRYGKDDLQTDRFICSQTLMMSMKGIPAFYIHSLLGTHNYTEGINKTGMARTVNRRKWYRNELYPLLDGDTQHAIILKELVRRIKIRKKITAFHPDSPQQVLFTDKNLFILTRGEKNKLIILANISPYEKRFGGDTIKIIPGESVDLLSGEEIKTEFFTLAPYRVLWLEQKKADSSVSYL